MLLLLPIAAGATVARKPRQAPHMLAAKMVPLARPLAASASARYIRRRKKAAREADIVSEPFRRLPDSAVIAGFDFSTGAVKGLAFDLDGQTLAEVRLPTDLWTDGGVSELNLMQLEGQARAAVRMLAGQLRDLGRLNDWAAGGVSATHHTAGRIDRNRNQVRRAICWNDQTLAKYHAEGLSRLGGPEKVRDLIGGPWAVRYSL